MEDKGKVSIIIGLFNVAKFLEGKRLSCILNQSWRDVEILLINDGSTDETLSISPMEDLEAPEMQASMLQAVSLSGSMMLMTKLN